MLSICSAETRNTVGDVSSGEPAVPGKLAPWISCRTLGGSAEMGAGVDGSCPRTRVMYWLPVRFTTVLVAKLK